MSHPYRFLVQMKHRFFSYLSYLISARYRNGHGIHSPFLFDFVSNVLFIKHKQLKYNTLQDFINKTDFPQLTQYFIENMGVVNQFALMADMVKKPFLSLKFDQLLLRMIDYYEPHRFIQLGVCAENGAMHIVTKLLPKRKLSDFSKGLSEFEPIENLLNGSAQLNSDAIQFLEFIDCLYKNQLDSEIVYFNCICSKSLLIAYFEQFIQKSSLNSIFVFNKIHYTSEMQNAWNLIKSHPKVSQSVDLYQIGIAFLRKGMSKEDYVIRF